MTCAVAVAVFLLLPCLHAEREGAEEGSQLGTVEFLFQRNHQALKACEGIHEQLGLEGNSNNSQTMKDMEHCITAIAAFAEKTRSQRHESLKANENYAEDMTLAKKILMRLTKQTDTHEKDFKDFKLSQEKAKEQKSSFLERGDLNTGVFAQHYWRPDNSYNHEAMDTMQAPMVASMPALMQAPLMASMMQAPMEAPMIAPMPAALQAPLMASMRQAPMEAPMIAPMPAALQAQQFDVPEGLVGRRPSFLQTGPSDGDLQEQLDIEAEKLQERDELEMHGAGRSAIDVEDDE